MPSIAAYVRSDGVNSAVYMGEDLHVHEIALVPGHNWQAYDLTQNSGGGLVGGDLAAYVRSDGVNAVLYVSLGSVSPTVIPSYLYQLSWKVGDEQWSALNLSQDAGVPDAWFPNSPVGFARSDGWNTVIFLANSDPGFFIGEISLAPGAGHWSAGSLEDSSNVTGIAACYYRNSGRLAVYVGSSADADETAHIFQSPIYPFAGRFDRDLNLAVPAAVLPFRVAKPACYVRSDGVTAVVYSGVDEDSLHELVCLPDGSWQLGGQLATGIGLVQSPACYVRSDGVNAIVYRGPDANIYELAGNSELNSLTELFGAPLAASNPVCYVRSDKVNSVVYVGVDRLIHELYLIPGQDWQHGTPAHARPSLLPMRNRETLRPRSWSGPCFGL